MCFEVVEIGGYFGFANRGYFPMTCALLPWSNQLSEVFFRLRSRFVFGLICSLFISGCVSGLRMKEVMQQCESYQIFSDYARCVETTYLTNGRNPDSSEIRAYLAQLKAIDEQYRYRLITNVQARAQAHSAYMNTIHNSGQVCFLDPNTNLMFCK